MRRAYLFGGLIACSLTAIWSCGLDDTAIVSLGDGDASTGSDAGGDATSFDSAPPNDSSTPDTGVLDSGTDTGVDAGPCPSTDLPICDDGTCASASQVCTPPISAGWTVVNYIAGGRPACTAGYAAHDVVQIADGGPAACVCSCTAGATPSCQNDNVVLGTGNAACTGSLSGNTMTAGCENLSLTVIGASYEATVKPSTACSGLLDASIPTVDAGLARQCELQPDAGSAALCEGHRACVPKPSTGSVCIAHAAPIACPNGFVQTNVADTFADSRSCPACGCDWSDNGCSAPVVTLHTAAACAANGTDVTVSTSDCNAITGTFQSLGLTGSAPIAAPTCGVDDGGVVDGGVTITNTEVICCSP